MGGCWYRTFGVAPKPNLVGQGKSRHNRPEIDRKSIGNRPELDRKSAGNRARLSSLHTKLPFRGSGFLFNGFLFGWQGVGATGGLEHVVLAKVHGNKLGFSEERDCIFIDKSLTVVSAHETSPPPPSPLTLTASPPPHPTPTATATATATATPTTTIAAAQRRFGGYDHGNGYDHDCCGSTTATW